MPAWACKVRAAGLTDPPQDCDWPHCGCDPHAEKVLAALEEEGWRPPRHADTSQAAAPEWAELREAILRAHREGAMLNSVGVLVNLNERIDALTAAFDAQAGRVREERDKALGLLQKIQIQHGCKHTDDTGIAPIEYQRVVERMLEEQTARQAAESQVSALQAQVKGLTEALEGLLAEHEDLIESEFGTGKPDPRFHEKWKAIRPAEAALAAAQGEGK